MEAVSLSDHLKLRFTGADRERWLNGQITQDVRKAIHKTALWSCICNHRGKLDGILTVSASPDSLWVTAEPSLAETLPLRLERYIIADDVALADVSAELALVHVLGEMTCEHRTASINRYGGTGTDVWLPLTAEAAFLENYMVLSPEEVEYRRIKHGHPAWDKELGPEILPPEAGLEPLTVDYHKGCYTGQEVISRMKTAGKTNKLLARFSCPSKPVDQLELPQPLFSATGQELGRLTSLAFPSTGGGAGAGLGYLLKAGYGATVAFTATGISCGIQVAGECRS